MAFTTTEFWMFGIMGMMVLFGICAALLNHIGKKRRRTDKQSNKPNQ